MSEVARTLARTPDDRPSGSGRWLVPALKGVGGAALVYGFATDLLVDRGDHLVGSLVWIALGVLPIYLVAVWLARRRPDHPQTRRLLMLAAGAATGTAIENSVGLAYAGPQSDGWLLWVNLIGQTINALMTVTAALLFATYPDGDVERGWQRALVRGVWVLLAVPLLIMITNVAVPLDSYLAESIDDPPATLTSPLFVPPLAPLGPFMIVIGDPILCGMLAIGVLFYRHLTAPAEQRRRMRILTYPLIASVPVLVASLTLRAAGVPADSWTLRVVESLYLPFLLAIPVSIVIGVLRYRLYDIDVIVRRSVVYGALTFGIALAYIALAVAPGLALGEQIPVQVAVVLTIVAAIAFQPVRRRLESLADRWVFGERVNRYRLLTDFGAGLEHTVSLTDLLPRLAQTVRQGLGAPWVRVRITGMPEATAGSPGESVGLRVPLEDRRLTGGTAGDVPGGVEIGGIECGARADGYDEQDRELLTTLAGQAAAAIANVRLSVELAERLAELDRSRARIVTAADAERRRIERDIHDGVQQQVVALMMKVRLARNQVGRGDRDPDDAFAELGRDVKDMLADLRELAHGIHPPVLSDGGLVAAVEARTARLPFPVRVVAGPELRERRFGDDVEGAAYFVVCEALTNVAKHTGGTDTEVGLSDGDGELSVVVRDRGSGFVTGSGPVTGSGFLTGSGFVANGRAGAGLTNLRDRVEALGGRLVIDSAPGQGTSVSAHLPIGANEATHGPG